MGIKASVRCSSIVLLVLLAVGPISHIVHGPIGLTWGVAFGLVASLVGTLVWGPGWGLVWGLSAGWAGGVGDANLLGGIQGMLAGGLVWGGAGGTVGRLLWQPPWRLDRSLSFIFYSGLVLPILGSIVVGLLGLFFDGFTLTGVGFMVGLFFGLAWGVGGVLGVLLGHIVRRNT